ncbi:MAG: hypothetical protein ACR2JS_08935 [Candidatus Nanopelagicales bacterium]
MSVRKLFLDPSDVSGAIFDRDSTASGITAFAGGGQDDAVLLTATYNRVSTVATAADSVKLPAAVAGSRVVVFNKGANSVTVFPSTGDKVNALSANAGYALAAAKGAEFVCMVNGTWDTILSA